MQLTESQQQAITAFADYLYHQEMDYHREQAKTRPIVAERLAALTEQDLAAFRQKLVTTAEADASDFLDTDRLLERERKGTFHPSNTGWRRLFVSLTGVNLPGTSGGTSDAIKAYIGPEKWDTYYAKRKAAADGKERQRQEAEAEQARKHLDGIAGKVRAGEPIDGSDLATLAQSLGFDPHPRTIGTLRKRVIAIGPNGGRVTGRGFLPDTVWNLYRDVAKTVNAQAA
jgi:hypothetical protein